MKKKLLIAVLSLLLTACLGKKNDIKDDAIFLQSAPVCTSDEMCKKMWQAAGDWVDQYSPQGIETYNDSLIRSEEKELGSDEMEIEVRKVKLKDNQYKIVIDTICTTSLGSCSAERDNMIAFNKKLASFMSAEKQTQATKVLEDNFKIKQWFERYNQFVVAGNASALTAMLHFPMTYIEEEKITVIADKNQLESFLNGVKKQFDELKGVYLKTESVDIFQHTGRNLYVNIISNLYDAENVSVAVWQSGYHLVWLDGKWMLVSTGLHTAD